MDRRCELKASDLRLEALVGTGSYAEVWRARARDNRVVALKRMLPHVARQPQAVAAFEREAKLLDRLNDDGIPRLLGSGRDGLGPYLVIEYVPGISLSQLLGTPVGLPLALRVVHDVLRTLEAVHEMRDDRGNRLGLVHRDLSAGNVLVSECGTVKLADFGIARAHVGTHATTGTMAKGTLAYMSPEQARGEPLDARSDLFSVGALLFELLCGAAPFDEADPKLALARARAADVGPFAQRCPGAAPCVCDLVDRALSARPSDRFATAQAMRTEVLLAAKTGGGLANDEQVAAWARTASRNEVPVAEVTGTTAIGPPRARSSRLAIVSIAAVALLGLGAWMLLGRSPNGHASVSPAASASGSTQAAVAAAALVSAASSAPAPDPSQSAAASHSGGSTPVPVRSEKSAKTVEPADPVAEATLDVGSDPSFAYVTIDGARRGSTPLFGVKLKPGSHRIVVERQGLGSRTLLVTLHPGEHASKVIRLP